MPKSHDQKVAQIVANYCVCAECGEKLEVVADAQCADHPEGKVRRVSDGKVLGHKEAHLLAGLGYID